MFLTICTLFHVALQMNRDITKQHAATVAPIASQCGSSSEQVLPVPSSKLPDMKTPGRRIQKWNRNKLQPPRILSDAQIEIRGSIPEQFVL